MLAALGSGLPNNHIAVCVEAQTAIHSFRLSIGDNYTKSFPSFQT